MLPAVQGHLELKWTLRKLDRCSHFVPPTALCLTICNRPARHEHLMMVYYDILLLDGESLLNVRYSERMKILDRIVRQSTGHAELVKGQTIDFSSHGAASTLRKAFAQVIVNRGEGLVLKADDSYFNFSGGRVSCSCCIKLKKEYIGNFGDVGDFAVVGAGYDSAKAKSYRMPNLKWTHFFIGCLRNREEVRWWGNAPEFTVVNVVEMNEPLMRTLTAHCNPGAVAAEMNSTTKLSLPQGMQQAVSLTTVFQNPLVFDMRCFSFDKGKNTGFWSLRFPAVTKIHFDRDFLDTISFEELQSMASEAVKAPEVEDSEENLLWIARLEEADPRGIAVDAASQLTRTTLTTPSPKRSTQSSTSRRSPATLISPKERGRSPPVPRRRMPTLVYPPQRRMLVPPPTFSDSLHPPPRGKQPTEASPMMRCERKRRRSVSTTSSLSSQRHTQARTLQARPLLEHIDCNSPQQSAASAHDKMNAQGVDEPRSQAVECLKSNAVDRSAQTKKTSYLKGRCTTANAYLRSHRSAKGMGLAPSPPAVRQPDVFGPRAREGSSCRLAGGKCVFARSSVFLFARVDDLPEMARTLIYEHGLDDVTTDIDDWLGAELKCQCRAGDNRPHNRVLLVDCQNKKPETTALISEIEERRAARSERLDWIAVYDWRVLQYLSIMEDDRIERKYYDGFLDPWRRWFCGLL